MMRACGGGVSRRIVARGNGVSRGRRRRVVASSPVIADRALPGPVGARTRRLPPARRPTGGMSCPLGERPTERSRPGRTTRRRRRTLRSQNTPPTDTPIAEHAADVGPRRRVVRPGHAQTAGRATRGARRVPPRCRHARPRSADRALPGPVGARTRRLPPARRPTGGMSCPLGERPAEVARSGRTSRPRRTLRSQDAPPTSVNDGGSCDEGTRRRRVVRREPRAPPHERPRAQPCAAASASARNRIRCASMSTSCRWISARRSACSWGSARCSCPSNAALRASRSRSTSATTMLRA